MTESPEWVCLLHLQRVTPCGGRGPHIPALGPGVTAPVGEQGRGTRSEDLRVGLRVRERGSRRVAGFQCLLCGAGALTPTSDGVPGACRSTRISVERSGARGSVPVPRELPGAAAQEEEDAVQGAPLPGDRPRAGSPRPQPRTCTPAHVLPRRATGDCRLPKKGEVLSKLCSQAPTRQLTI